MTGICLSLVLAALLWTLQRPVGAADLVQVYLDARQQDPLFAGARDAWAATQEKLPQARAGLLPSATLTAGPNYTDRNIAFRNGTSTQGRFNSNGVTVAVTQPLLRMQNLAQYRGAGSQLAQADFVLAAAAQDLILRVAQAYFDILLAQDNLEFAVAQKAAIQEQLAVARRNYQLGAAAITDAHDAQARFDLAASLEITARSDLENRKEALQQIIGKPAPALSPLGSRFAPRSPDPGNALAWVEQSVATSHQIGIQKAAVEFAEQEVARNRYGHYPTLDAVANYSETAAGQGTLGGIGNDTRATVVGLQLSLPIFLGGSVSSQVRQAQSNLSKARQDLEATQRQVATAVKQAFLGVTSGMAQIKALETALQSSQSSLQSSILGREVGIRTQVDVLNAQQQLFTARFNLAQARYNYILSWLKLKSGSGQLAEDDVRQINEWLAAPAAAPGIATWTDGAPPVGRDEPVIGNSINDPQMHPGSATSASPIASVSAAMDSGTPDPLYRPEPVHDALATRREAPDGLGANRTVVAAGTGVRPNVVSPQRAKRSRPAKSIRPIKAVRRSSAGSLLKLPN